MKINQKEEEKIREAKALAGNLKEQAISIFVFNDDKRNVARLKPEHVEPPVTSKSIGNDKLRVGVEFSELGRGAKTMASFDKSNIDRK